MTNFKMNGWLWTLGIGGVWLLGGTQAAPVIVAILIGGIIYTALTTNWSAALA